MRVFLRCFEIDRMPNSDTYSNVWDGFIELHIYSHSIAYAEEISQTAVKLDIMRRIVYPRTRLWRPPANLNIQWDDGSFIKWARNFSIYL